MAYVAGGTKGICDRCGFEFPLRDLKKEWSGLKVCRADYDPTPPQTRPANVTAEGLPLKDSRPDNQGGNEPNTTTAGDL